MDSRIPEFLYFPFCTSSGPLNNCGCMPEANTRHFICKSTCNKCYYWKFNFLFFYKFCQKLFCSSSWFAEYYNSLSLAVFFKKRDKVKIVRAYYCISSDADTGTLSNIVKRKKVCNFCCHTAAS